MFTSIKKDIHKFQNYVKKTPLLASDSRVITIG